MPLPSLDPILPRDLRSPFAWFGRHNWLRLGTERIGRQFKMGLAIPPRDPAGISAEDYDRVISIIRRAGEAALHDLPSMYTRSVFFAEGVKLFRPTLTQCQAMLNVSIDLPASEFEQPFRCVMFEFPKELSHELAKLHSSPRVVTYVVAHHDIYSRFLHICAYFSNGEATSSIIPPDKDRTVEEILALPEVDENGNRYPRTAEEEAEFSYGEALQRLTLAFCLFLVQPGLKLTSSPADVKTHEKHLKMARSPDPHRRRKGRDFLTSDVKIVSFDQTVKMFRESGSGHSAGEDRVGDAPPGREMSPHWRKGYFRMQPHGIGKTLRKRIFIRPVMIRADKFFGATSDTSATYE